MKSEDYFLIILMYAIRDRVIIIRLLNHVIKRLLFNYFSVCDRRSCDYYSITQPYDQKAIFQSFQYMP